MAVINVTNGTQAILTIGANASATVATAQAVPSATPGAGLVVPFVQDITVSAQPGTVRYSTLDSPSSSAFTTVNENSISLNLLVDETVMFGTGGSNVNLAVQDGLFGISTDKQEVSFSVSITGTGTTGDIYIAGRGFIGGLAPTASIDGAVWLSPCEIIVNGELTKTVE
jgi:hypothetical protein